MFLAASRLPDLSGPHFFPPTYIIPFSFLTPISSPFQTQKFASCSQQALPHLFTKLTIMMNTW